MFGIAILSLLGIGLVADLVSDDDDDQQDVAEAPSTPVDDGEDLPTTPDAPATLVFTEFVESGTAVGTAGIDDIAGGDGANTLFGGGETDLLSGGAGNDSIFGGDGNDDLHGQSGNDLIRGGDGDDYILGGTGNDTLNGDAGNDTLVSNDAFDTDNFVNSIRSSIYTGSEVDDGVNFENELAETDTLFGGAGDDVLFVAGNDVATTGQGSDFVSSGFWMEAGEEAIVTDFEQGEDVLVYNYDAALGEPEVSFDENEEGDAQFLINDEVVMVLENVDFTTLSNNDVQLFSIDLTQL